MANTANYNWETPDDTDLVKDGAAAIRTLGSAIDTTVFNNASAAIAKSIIDAKGDLISATAADTPARLAVGANNTVLTADSSTATGLKWAIPAAGGMTQLATGTLSGSAVDITSISGSYRNLRLVITGFVPANDNTSIRVRLNSDTGTAYTDQPYNWALTQPFDQTFMTLTFGNDNVQNQGLIIFDIPEYANTSSWKLVNSWVMTVNATTTANVNYGQRWGMYNSTSAISAINLFPSSGNFSAGTYTLYGVS